MTLGAEEAIVLRICAHESNMFLNTREHYPHHDVLTPSLLVLCFCIFSLWLQSPLIWVIKARLPKEEQIARVIPKCVTAGSIFSKITNIFHEG